MDIANNELTSNVLRFAATLAAIPESDLTRDWPAPSAPGTFWHGYDDTVRDIAFRVYQQLRELVADGEVQRPSLAWESQRILAQHHLAYRDLTGALAGVHESEFDLIPAENEWPLRTVVYHIALAERGFHALIHWAAARRRGGDIVPIVMPDDHRDSASDPIVETGTMTDVLQRYETLHMRVLSDFAFLDAADLDAPNIWWEGYEVPVRFRMHRFDTHLREHTIQVDKTLVGIGHPPTEPERLARLLHRALGEVEGVLLGSTTLLSDRQHVLAAEIDDARKILRSLTS